MADTLVPRALAALRAQGRDTLVVAGGVAANGTLRTRFLEECQKEKVRLFFPPLSLCGDNAAMVGAQAYFEAQAGHYGTLYQNAAATLPLEEAIYTI